MAAAPLAAQSASSPVPSAGTPVAVGRAASASPAPITVSPRPAETAVIQLVSAEEPIEGVVASSGEAQWIWSSTQAQRPVPKGTVYFRKWFTSSQPELAFVQITCDDAYEVYVNGRLVGSGKDWHKMQTFDLMPFLIDGKNLIAVKAENADGPTAGLVARVVTKRAGGAEVGYSTDDTWLTNTVFAETWEKNKYDDSKWFRAAALGELGIADPWRDDITADDGSSTRRFTVTKDFRIERVVHPNDTGSLLCLCFNEWGELLVGREDGPIQLIVDSNKDGVPDRVTEYCPTVKSVQALLALNGQVYCVGVGPEGGALYRLSDDDQDGKAENVKRLVEFDGKFGEHGPHGLALGPDGLIYCMIGNHAQAKNIAPKGSPYQNYYEGDLLTPKYEDPGGHAAGVKAPGGSVIRFDPEGATIQLYSGGFRNAYDLAFNRDGELFSFDSDMEWDEGLPWYRSTRLDHVYPGSEHGWRSGWSTWPIYHFDSTPPAATAGRGSPTGIEFYHHHRFPAPYHGALFACDWSQGEIIAFKPRTSGSGYTSDGEVFVRGRPLAVTDVAVGPDGWLYFVTGGRGTEGGVYRVVYVGPNTPPPKLSGVAQAVRQPQLQSAWARQQIALLQEQTKDQWDAQLRAVAGNKTNRAEDRVRALDLLQLYGPYPSIPVLSTLARDAEPTVRKKAAFLLGIHADPHGGGVLVQCLRDPDAGVRRQACESLVRGGFLTPPEVLLPLLADPDRAVAFNARLALEAVPVDRWKQIVLQAPNVRTFIGGAMALVRVSPDRETVLAVLARGSRALRGELSDPDFLDLLRVFEVALERGQIKPAEIPELAKQLVEEYPSAEPRMNRELLRLVAYINDPSVLPRIIDYLKSDAPQLEKIQAAIYARFITEGWTIEQRLVVLDFYEKARKFEGGYSIKGYISNVCKDFCAKMTVKERQTVLSYGARQPANALAMLGSLESIDPDLIGILIELDKYLPANPAPEARTLQTGAIAILGESKDPRAMAYLRDAFEKTPERRGELAMGLAQLPEGENWPLLVRSLAFVEGVQAQEVLLQLAKTEGKPETPDAFRHAIICGLRLGDTGADAAVKLLAKWTGKQMAEGTAWNQALAGYQQWFVETYPTQPPPTLPKSETASRYTHGELTAFLSESSTKGNPAAGALVFEKANCIKCHRFGNRGESIGPDLSTVAQRFTRKEILESVLFPSQVISDQYSSKTVTTTDGKVLSGIVAPAGDTDVLVLQADGTKTQLALSQIEDMQPNKKSAMPEGLFNTLGLQEIADLFAFMNAGGAAAGQQASPITASPQSSPLGPNANSRRANTLRK
jgi:putative heme-binding domain-containing protein